MKSAATRANPIDVGLVLVPSQSYPDSPPFHPQCVYPELLRIPGMCSAVSPNYVYEGVRQLFHSLGLDGAAYGTREWNPLGELIRPGNTVVIKPNLVLHQGPNASSRDALTTHGSVLRAVIDYAFLAAGPNGKVVIADAPLQSARFNDIVRENGLDEIRAFYRTHLNYELQVIDLRQVVAVKDDTTGFMQQKTTNAGDPNGYVDVDIGHRSLLEPLARRAGNPSYRVTDYSAAETAAMHASGSHKYVIAKTILDADAVVLVPKLKVHEKVGLTVCLKGMVGIIGSKACLPHFRAGSPSKDGDEFPDRGRWLSLAWSRVREWALANSPHWLWRILRSSGKRVAHLVLRTRHLAALRSPVSTVTKPVTGGAWPGNDTAWRMSLDLNYIFKYARPDGTLAETSQRNCLAVVDGVVGGEGSGPLDPTPKPSGMLVGGLNPWSVDVTCAELIGLDWRKLKILNSGWPWYEVAGDHIPFAVRTPSAVLEWPEVSRSRVEFQPPPHWHDVRLR